MKLIMENWRGYVKKEELFEDYEYVTNILGIALPLDESGQAQLTEELKGQIFREHVLYEGFIGSLVSAAKNSAGKIKDLLWTLAQILKDSSNLKNFIRLLTRSVRLATQPFIKVFNKMRAAGGKVAEFAEKVLSKLEALFQNFKGLADGWKKAIIGCTLMLLLKWSYDKAKDMIKDALSGDLTEELVTFLKEKFFGFFGKDLKDLFDNVIKKASDIKTYLGWIGPIVGGVNFVAQTLGTVTGKMRHLSQGLSQ